MKSHYNPNVIECIISKYSKGFSKLHNFMQLTVFVLILIKSFTYNILLNILPITVKWSTSGRSSALFNDTCLTLFSFVLL